MEGQRLRFIARLLDGERMAALCAEFGISRKTGYKIYDRRLVSACAAAGRGCVARPSVQWTSCSPLRRGDAAQLASTTFTRNAFANARPDPDLRYRSNRRAASEFGNWKLTTNRQGRYGAVYSDPPELCVASRCCTSQVIPTYGR